MVGIDVVETSGVDHPAHLQEGWLVCKSASGQDLQSLFGLATEGSTVPEKQNASEPATKAAGPTVEELQKENDALKAKLAAAQGDKGKPFGKSAEEEQEEFLKAAPAGVRLMFEKAAAEAEELRKQAATDRQNFEKERDARLDQAAVTEFEGLYKAIALDAGEVAPALRQVELISPDLAKSLRTALAAADKQLETAGLFKEVGKDTGAAGDGTALARIEAAAAELQKADTTLTAPAAFAKAVEASPELYTAYLEEMRK